MSKPTVFLDTQVFITGNYQFGWGSLKLVSDLAARGDIHLILTPIVIREVRKHIKLDAKKANDSVKSLQNKGRILRNLGFEQVFGYDDADVETRLLDQFESFLKHSNATTVSIDPVKPSAVFEKYFAVSPPFGPKEKEKEFADAFSLEAIRIWADANGLQVFIVSEDGDHRTFCEGTANLIHLDKIEMFLELLLSDDESRLKLAHALVERVMDDVEKAIAKEFEDKGFLIMDEDGDVIEVTVDNVELPGLYVVRMEDNEIYVEFGSEIEYSADVSYKDPESWIYDSEEKAAIYLDTVEKTIKRSIEIDGYFSVHYETDPPYHPTLDDLGLAPENIEVNVSQEDE